MVKNICHSPGCDSQDFSALLYGGKQFCKYHYDEKFFDELMTHYESWDGEPPDRLKYLIGRYYAEHETALINEPYLTKAIVHERSYAWKKTEGGAVFTTIRYPVNRKLGEPYFDEVHQTWNFNVKERIFTFLSEKK